MITTAIAILTIGLIDYALGRTTMVKPNSLLQAVLLGLHKALENVPGVGKVLAKAADARPPSLSLALLAVLVVLPGCGLPPGAYVRNGIAVTAKALKTGYAIARSGAKGCAAKAAAIPNKQSAQLALDGCRATWARDLDGLDAATDVVIAASIAVPAFDAGAKAVDGKTPSDWVAALAAAATAAAKIADQPPVKDLP